MQFSESWLREWANPAISTQELADQLSLAGLEVDAVTAVADFSGVVVAEIVGCEPHPDAEKLRVCQVQADEDTPLQIVCGAPNAREGLKVALAKVGAVLPGDFKIKKAKLRGVESYGMLCGANELAIGEDTGGLMELDSALENGQDLKVALNLNDTMIEVDLTPNRSDCLSIQGLAREVSAINSVAVTAIEISAVETRSEKAIAVNLASDVCGYYCGQVIENIDISKPSPLWLTEKLRRSGIQSINVIVDVTNYVMLELGQPMHAFDLAKIDGGITVRPATAKEKLQLLSDKEIELLDGSLVIADDAQALALAGIMGGEDSSVTDATTSIFLESAFFDPTRLAGEARKYGLHTDSSHRFERGVDPELPKQALNRAAQLITEIAGGEAGPVVEQGAAQHITPLPEISLTLDYVNKLLGTDLSAERVEEILKALNFEFKSENGTWLVTAPSYRFDIQRNVDLIEEIARIFGYNNLPTCALKVDSLNRQTTQESWVSEKRLKHILVSRDFQEVITYSFVAKEQSALFFPELQPKVLLNPISSELSSMRVSLLMGLVQTFQHNLNRQQSRVRIFETGQCFIQDGDQYIHENRIAGLVYGARFDESWTNGKNPVDFYDIKGDVEALCAVGNEFGKWQQGEHPAMHPGQCAELILGGQSAGFVGAMHPELQQQLGIKKPVFIFELSLAPLQYALLPWFKSISKFPEMRRDLAFTIKNSVQVSQIYTKVSNLKVDNLRDYFVFDVYQNESMGDEKSLALACVFQNKEQTLSDEEINQSMKIITYALVDAFEIELRG